MSRILHCSGGIKRCLPVTDVTPVPEHAVIVEQSVMKLLVIVPDTKFVPLHRGIPVAEQLIVIDVISVAPV